jgi:membrane-associated phospholipid phosphatase
MDAVLQAGRSAFAHALVLPLAWVQGFPTAQSLRAEAFAGREIGTNQVINLQNKFIHPWLTRFLSWFTLCADGDFYLVLLPLLLWNGTPWVRLFATHLTIIVTIGTPMGGLIKDALCVLRPASPPVWRPAGQEAMDTMGLKDYSYPSTHAINAVTNTGVLWLFCVETGAVQGVWLLALTAAVCGYALLLSFSRLYLGAHVWSDIYFGWLVGALLVTGYWFGGPKDVFETGMLAGELDWRLVRLPCMS